MILTQRQSEEVLLLLEGADRVNARLLEKCSDAESYRLAKECAEACLPTTQNRTAAKLNASMKKMFDSTRYLNCEKYESDYLSRKAK